MSFRIVHEWLRVFDAEGRKGQYSHVRAYELREYSDGTTRVHSGPAIYLRDVPEAAFAHAIYVRAEAELRGLLISGRKCRIANLPITELK